MRKLLAVLALMTGLLPLAHADIYGFVDDKGVAHFAAEKVDERYQLFYRGGQSFDTSQGLAAPPPAAGGAPPRLLAYIEKAPGYLQVRRHLREASSAQGIDYELLQALIATESGFDVDAVSPKGAIGLMQVLPATAQRYGLAGDRKRTLDQKLADPRTNIRTGSRYLSDLIRLFPGQLELALAAYNAGEGAVQRAGNRIPNYRETRNYVKTVMQLYTLLKPAAPPQMADRAPLRIRMELPVGGAVGRGNLPTGLPLAAAPDPAPLERE
ncbi:lytic transglycosylase domain-containing protein [Caenimonas terrae]|uniref:Lytic transglycosylase domain-containing protein n=1 Tax=Caenimonas terrae TaxID=696074 RepID=A0ABW0ND76_9BURK